MSKAKDIISKLEAKISALEASLENISDPEIVASAAVQELGGYPKAGVKVVDSNYNPGHRPDDFTYRPGNTLTADDWDCTPRCGRGLHYSGSIDESKTYCHAANWRAVIVVATSAHVEIDSSKSKAQTLRVDREIDVSGWNDGAATRGDIKEIRRAIESYALAQWEYKRALKELKGK